MPTQKLRFSASERKFKGTHPRRRVLTPTRDPDGMRYSLGASAARAAQTTLRGAESLAGGSIRRTFPEPRSDTVAWRKAAKTVAPPASERDRPRGLRSLAIPKPPEVIDGERKHFKAWNSLSRSASEFSGGGLGCKIRVKQADGQPACERQADEQDVSKVFGRKKRVDATATLSLRNGIGAARPGDKMYSSPDYAPGFFKGGGVYPGSGWGHQKALQPYHTTQYAAGARAAAKAAAEAEAGVLTYEQKRRFEIMAKEVDEVRALNPMMAGEDSSDEEVDEETWEGRTGKFTITPRAAAAAVDGEADAYA